MKTTKTTKSAPKANTTAQAKREALKAKLNEAAAKAKAAKVEKKTAKQAKKDDIETANGTPLKAKDRKALNALGFDLFFSSDAEGEWVTFHIIGRNAWFAMPKDAEGKKVMIDFTEEVKAHVESLLENAKAAKAA